MTRQLLHSATILTVDPHDRVIENGWLVIEDDRIGAIGGAADQPSPAGFDSVTDLSGHLLMPGLVNAHTHSAMVLFRGHAEGHSLLTMEGWYNTIREPELAMIAEDMAPAVALSCAEMVLSGTTTFCDQYFFAEEIAAAAARAGIRAVIAYGIVQLGDEVRGDEELAKASAFVEGQRSADGRIIPWFGPHAPYVDNSEALLLKEVAVANRLGCGIHLHMACGPEDNVDTLARYGTTASVALEKAGFFNGRIHAAHCLDLSDEDIAVFARAEAASVAHCASAGLRSGREAICPVVPLRQAGVTVALGTDNVAANNSYDMVSEMRVAGLVASHREGRAQPISSRELVRMATIEGARALGLDHEIGSIEIGKAADLAAIDISGPGYSTTPDVATLLVYSGSGRDTRHVWVAGEQLVRDRALTRRPFADIRADYNVGYRTFWERVALTRKVA
ncbi:amidohydrolase family protein [Kaistia dalseonensis]|uniref:5-methylthioadenosine/S-adenosylhomocysteine deaminase n=1 Tax=Kaistia dalseonensis TaxID=410840 RepID=A0ABU0HAR1_9HYPH|nr:amidohydrolase family protein [Kaistia dalseonensis]MCX5496776.1 amidohydrolase family protein [Kaistia dalseonensis]MDQ0439401.1 5-methylthioadenosine/S-adenosylhomocysteine deaminase [Kaistia dalseonensis]